jgi:putative flippase GtrA
MYLLVGVWKTVVAFVCFSLLYYFLHQRLGTSLILVLTYLIASLNGYVSFRYLVFSPVAHPVVEYVRYQAVYFPIFLLNIIVLPLALKHSSLSAYVIQGAFACFAVVVSYLGNKYYTFRKPRATGGR